MCGICGIVDYSGRSPEQQGEAVQHMVESLHHRGPNHAGVFGVGPVSIGHTRLSVIDLSSAAHQPMHSADNRYSLVYNGEIYNFKELRQVLVSTGRTFRTDSDTEVLLQAYEEYGADCVKKLSGMFAFAVWDKQREELFLARDRFGQKPLFYSQKGNRFSFASELKALFQDPTLTRSPNFSALFHYLTFQSIPAPLSAFANVAKLLPGECLLVNSAGTKQWRYWQPFFNPTFIGSEEEAIEELEMLLRQALRSHLVSDVPLGLFLSGGVDSSLIAAFAAQQSGTIHSFSMGFAEAGYDERPYARQVASLYNTCHRDEVTSHNIKEILPAIVKHYGEPFADSSAIPTWLLSQMTAKHVTVALSGDGGDDLFGGYERFLNPFLFPANEGDTAEIADKRTQLERCGDNSAAPGVIKYYSHWARFFGQRKMELCTPEFKAAAPLSTFKLLLACMDEKPATHPLDKIQQFELDAYLASTLLPKVDVASMASSLEVRAPFLDNAVADFALSLPVDFRIRALSSPTKGSFSNGYESKWLLKKVGARHLPDSIVYRKKMGFGIPLGQWLGGSMSSYLKDVLLSQQCRERGWINPKKTEELITEHLNGVAHHHYGLWALLMLELWAQDNF